MPRTILIQDPDVLISLDLAQTVMEGWPNANLVLCRHGSQVNAILSGGQKLDALILRQSMRSTRETGLANLAHKSKARVVLTDADEDEAHNIAAMGWQALDMPFSAAQVRAALQGAFEDADHCKESHCNAIGLR